MRDIETNNVPVSDAPAKVSVLGSLLIAFVRFYQRWIRLALGQNCRFYPSCSEYFILAVRKHGALRGAAKGVGRICRCHPFHPGGIDYP